ncbi:hypothetical protein [Bacillus sp. 1NLA3E]|uniref:hypothetical protein n=1 Tax=Bacillus sp. 1NLA3E TaxID=666686 RepID=UPI000247F421|nr:hypothetical protein [Bacillus sp. 1NLA3E]AGK52051.1 hypothetical protein B1NLA3E_01335 [Bacillus sp. 1NLA3E]
MDLSLLPPYISASSAVISVGIAALSVRNLIQKNKQDSKEKKELQARNISAWIIGGGKESQIILQNISNTPIYNVFVIAVAITGAATGDGEQAMKMNDQFSSTPLYPYLVFQKVPPGKFVKDFGFLEGGMNISFGLELAFTDTYGNCWRIDRNGKLFSLKDNYLYEKYALENPTAWNYIDYFNDSI